MKDICKQIHCSHQEGGSVHRGVLGEDGDEERRGHQEEEDGTKGKLEICCCKDRTLGRRWKKL